MFISFKCQHLCSELPDSKFVTQSKSKTQKQEVCNVTICAKGAQLYLSTKSALTYLGGTDSIIQAGSDSLLICSIIYNFVTTKSFNCHGTIACIATCSLGMRKMKVYFSPKLYSRH